MDYPKPTKFSDNYLEWEGCEDELRKILSKADDDLTTEDYAAIFYRNLPPADYPEGAYYISRCISHIARGRDVHASRFPDGFLWWLVHFKDQLKQDQAFDTVKRSLMSALFELLDQFELFDLTEEECKAVRRNFECSVGPYNSSTVCDIIDELTMYDEFQPELAMVEAHLTASDRIEHARWYVEIAFHTRSWLTTFRDDDDGWDDYQRKEALFHRLHSFAVLQKKQRAASTATAEEGKFKYNRLVML